jgi:P27 family predicted phage terminase small subunit
MKNAIPRAPSTLKASGRAFWKKVHSNFEIENEHHLRLLETAGQCLDRLDECRDILAAEGLCTVDRFGQMRAHPATSIERDQKALFVRILRELGLDIPSPDSRPPRKY